MRSEFLQEINTYMTKFAYTYLKDFDKAEDVVQYAWQEVLEHNKIDFDRSEKELKNYLLTAVKFVIKNRSRMAFATGTNLNDSAKSIKFEDLNQKFHAEDPHYDILERILPVKEQGYAFVEIAHDIRKVVDKLSKLEKKFFTMVLNGVSKGDAAAACERTNQWGYNACDKIYRLVENI